MTARQPTLSPGQARCLQLAAQGLLRPMRRCARREDLVAAVERMRLLQIDSIHVVARSQYLVLRARLGDYPTGWLDELLADGHLAECWAHEACLVPAADVGLHRAWSAQRDRHWAHRHAAAERREHPAEMRRLLDRIRRDGPMTAADAATVARARGSTAGWWAWKPEKRWLEAWFALGELMVARRERFQRVYDLAANVLARLQPAPAAAPVGAAALRRHFVLDAVRALGITPARWVADYHRLRRAVADPELAPLVAKGVLIEVSVAGWPYSGYVHRDHEELLVRAQAGKLRATHTALLSPFDPLVWDRSRLEAMFAFRYALECYVPAARRQFGYYVLPILHRGRLVGRLDAKAQRARQTFLVRKLVLEPDVVVTPRLVEDVAQALVSTARWHGTPDLDVRDCEPPALDRALRRELVRLQEA